jgi:hypothetical protein
VLSTVRETLGRAAAASVSGDGGVDELVTIHRTNKLLRTLRADCGVSEAVRSQARQLQHAARHGKHGQQGKQAAAMKDKGVLTAAVLTMEDKEGKTADRRRDVAGVSAPEISVPEISVPEISAPEISAPEISAPEISAPEISAPEPEVSGRTEILSRRSSTGSEIELPWEMREMPVGEHADHDTGRASSEGRWPAPAAAGDVPQPQPQPQPAEGISQTSCHAKEPSKPRPRPLAALSAGVNSPRKMAPSPLARVH